MSLHTLLEAAHFVDTDSDEETKKNKKQQSLVLPTAPPELDIQVGTGSKVESSGAPATSGAPAPSRSRRAQRIVGAGVTREVHNQLEKNRRAQLKTYFENLRQQLPGLWDKKTSNLSILKGALDCIEELKRKDREHELETNQLRRQKRMKQEQLRTLKNELGQEKANRILSHIEHEGGGGETMLQDDHVVLSTTSSVTELQPAAVYASSISGTKWHSHIEPPQPGSSSNTTQASVVVNCSPSDPTPLVSDQNLES